jgi:chromosome segregation ATPase
MENQMKEMSVKYGGLWQNYYDQLHLIRQEKERTEQSMLAVLSENALLKLKNEEHEENMKRILSSLSEQSCSNLQYSDILKQIKAEKESLKMKLLTSESQEEYCRKQIQSLNFNIQHWQQNSQELEKCNRELLKELEKHEVLLTRCQKDIALFNEKLANACTDLKEKDEKINILKRAVGSKDKIIKALTQERNALKEELDSTISCRTKAREKTPSILISTVALTQGQKPRPVSAPRRVLDSHSAEIRSADSSRLFPPRFTALTEENVLSPTTDSEPLEDTPRKVLFKEQNSPLQENLPVGLASISLDDSKQPQKNNPWFKTVPRSDLRHAYRKASTPTQMRRRMQELKTD